MTLQRKLILGWVSLLVAGLCACGELHQDPLAGQDDRFRDPRNKPEPANPGKPVPSDALRILAPNFASFEEGKMEDFTIQGRVLVEGYAVDLKIDNLADFPGATYDPAKQLFAWSPPAGWVDSKSSGGIFHEIAMNIRAEARKEGAPVLVASRQVMMRVGREFTNPEVLRIDLAETFMREGQYSGWFYLYVRDPDADLNDRSTWPRISMESVNSYVKNLTGYVQLGQMERYGGKDFRLNMWIDLRDRELTSSVEKYGFKVIATSRFGRSSSPRELLLDIYTSFEEPITTWNDTLEAKVGQTLTHTFLILDPKQEGVLHYVRSLRLPPGAQINCQSGSKSRSVLNCTLVYTPEASDIGEYEIESEVELSNADSRDKSTRIENIFTKLKVIAGGN